MSVGRITVDLLARTGSFETDMARAAKTAEKRAKEIDAAVTKAGAAVGLALSAAGIAAIHFGKQVIDGLDALNDVKDATGASIESLSALEDVALRTGTNMENVSSILVKFNKALSDADGKNGVSQALKALGLSAEELKSIDPAEALRQTAVALSKFADDGNKARLVQELFGKSIKEAAPFLKDLAEKTELVGKVTEEQAQAAEDFNKALASMQKNSLDAARSLVGNLLPALNEILKAFNSGGLTAAINTFGDRVLGWGDNAGRKTIQNLRDDVKRLEAEANHLNKIFGGTAAPSKELAAKRSALAAAEQAFFKFNPATGGGRGFVNPPNVDVRPSLPSVGVTPPKTGKAAKEHETEFQRYLENLQKQLDKTKELTVAETVLADIAGGRLKLQKGESADVLVAVAKQIDAAKSLKDYNELAAAAEKAKDAALLESATSQEAKTQSLAEGNQKLREEIEVIGKSIEAQAAIEAARLSSAIAVAEQNLAYKESIGALERETDAIKSQIQFLKERQDLIGQKGVAEQVKKDADEAKDFAKSVGAAFSSSFEKAILEGGKLSDVLKGLAKDILGLYIRNAITGPIAKSIGEFSGGGGGGFDFGSILSGIGTFFGGMFKAEGGPVAAGKGYMVGEQGPEWFKPNTSGAIVPNHAMGGGGTTIVNNNFTVGDVATVSMVRQAISNSQKQSAGAIGRSQRYGGALA